jgi:hypothetical protein
MGIQFPSRLLTVTLIILTFVTTELDDQFSCQGQDAGNVRQVSVSVRSGEFTNPVVAIRSLRTGTTFQAMVA